MLGEEDMLGEADKCATCRHRTSQIDWYSRKPMALCHRCRPELFESLGLPQPAELRNGYVFDKKLEEYPELLKRLRGEPHDDEKADEEAYDKMCADQSDEADRQYEAYQAAELAKWDFYRKG